MQSRPIIRQAALRLIFSLGLFVLLLGVSSYQLYSIALQKSAKERSRDMATFYSARLSQLDRDWTLHARDFKANLEATRLLEKPKTSATALQAFMTVQGTNRRFQYLLIQNGNGDKIFDFGTALDLPEIPVPPGQESSWYLSKRDGNLFRVLVVPIWLGKYGNGRLAVFYEIDNSLLFSLTTPDIVLSVRHNGSLVASSAGHDALEREKQSAPEYEDAQVREIQWSTDAADKTLLRIDAPVKTPFSKTELTVGAAAIPVIDGLILWFTLGFWLMGSARRIRSLGGAVEEFTAQHQPTARMEEKLQLARGRHPDEISEVACAIAYMARQTRRLQLKTATLLSRNQILMQNAMDGIHVMDMQGNIVDANDAFCEMLGYTHQEIALLNVADWDAQWSAEQLRERFKWLIGNSARFETVHRRKDGELITVEISTSGMEIEGQGLLFAASRDITERKRAEAALQNSAANLRAMLDNSPYLSWLKDAEGRYIMINKIFADYLRLEDADQAAGKTDFDLQPAELAKKYRADDNEVMAARQQRHVEESAFDGNAIHWVETFKTPVIGDNGKVLGTAGFARDITERKKAEAEKLQSSETGRRKAEETRERLIAHLEGAPDFVGFADAAATHLLYINRAGRAMTGISEDEDISRLKFGDICPASARQQLEKVALPAAARTGIWQGESVFLDRAGHEIPVSMVIVAHKSPEGAVEVFSTISRDITERKKIEMKLQQSYRKLQQLALHMSKMREEERGRIARELHDEMGATLTALKMSVHWLTSRLPAEMTQIAAETAHMDKLLSDMIHTMRNVVHQLKPTLLHDIGFSASIKHYMQNFQKQSGIECMLALPEQELALDDNQASAIFRMFQESLNNVAKHAQATQVSIQFINRDHSLILMVKDNGIGFSRRALQNNSFGLLGIRERALLVNGKARISSKLGKGTQVVVSIPLAKK